MCVGEAGAGGFLVGDIEMFDLIFCVLYFYNKDFMKNRPRRRSAATHSVCVSPVWELFEAKAAHSPSARGWGRRFAHSGGISRGRASGTA